jgi:hypothetical protein
LTTIYDVTSSIENYGPKGAYKEYAGHDITLALSMNKTDPKWMDKFVKMDKKWIRSAQGWSDFYATKYPAAGPILGRSSRWKNGKNLKRVVSSCR